MNIKFKQDKNGKIIDSDKLFDKIDEQLDNEEYSEVVTEILSIPREKWSNKLRFRLVTAYNNLRDFAHAERELDEVAELSEAPNDVARCHYSRGYMCYMKDKDIMAREHYRNAAKIDPEYAKEIDLEEDINECGRNISEDLSAFNKLCESVTMEIRKRCSESGRKKDISDEAFQVRLGFFPGIRKLPGFDHPIGFGDYFVRYESEDKAKCRQWFEKFYGITDNESFFHYIQTDIGCNNARMFYDVAAYLTNKPNFDVKELDDRGRFAFENATLFISTFIGYVPKAGVLAWDLCEKIGFARHAYGCGLISNSEYCEGMLALSDTAKRNFSSWEEYMLSLIFGAALFMYVTDEWSIPGAADFVSSLAPLLVRSDLAEVRWYRPESRFDRDNYKRRKG